VTVERRARGSSNGPFSPAAWPPVRARRQRTLFCAFIVTVLRLFRSGVFVDGSLVLKPSFGEQVGNTIEELIEPLLRIASCRFVGMVTHAVVSEGLECRELPRS
jgi:hypothetical protein